MKPKDADLIDWLNNLETEEKKALLEQLGMNETVEGIVPAKLELLEAALALLPSKPGGGPNRVQ